MQSTGALTMGGKATASQPKIRLLATPALGIQLLVRRKQEIRKIFLIPDTARAAKAVRAGSFVDEGADDSYNDACITYRMRAADLDRRTGTEDKRWQFSWKAIASVLGGPLHLP